MHKVGVAAYRNTIQSNYLDYLRKQQDFPVLILDVTAVDFLLDEKLYETIKEELTKPLEVGIHYKILNSNSLREG